MIIIGCALFRNNNRLFLFQQSFVQLSFIIFYKLTQNLIFQSQSVFNTMFGYSIIFRFGHFSGFGYFENAQPVCAGGGVLFVLPHPPPPPPSDLGSQSHRKLARAMFEMYTERSRCHFYKNLHIMLIICNYYANSCVNSVIFRGIFFHQPAFCCAQSCINDHQLSDTPNTTLISHLA